MSNSNTTSVKNEFNADDFYKDEPESGFKAVDLLATARMRLLQEMPFFGKIAQNMPLVEQNNIPTTAVDARGRLYFNVRWVNHMDMVDAIFEVGHEVMHLVQRIFDRKPDNVNHALYNKAGDWLCDTSLVDAGLPQSKISKMAVGPKEQAITRELGTINNVYNYLLKNAEEDATTSGCKACQQALGMTKDMSAEEDKQQKAENKELNEGNGDGPPGMGSANEESKDEGGEANSSDGGGGCGGEESLEHTCGNIRQCCVATTADFEEGSCIDEQKWTEIVIAAKMYAEGKGNMPGEIGKAITNLTKSTVRWQDFIKSRATKIFGRDRYTFKRPNRRGHAIGMRLAGQKPDGKSAVISVDSSSSMCDEYVVQSVTEASAILTACGAEKIWLILHDSVVYFSGYVGESDLTKLKCSRGGTSHREVFAAIDRTHPNEEFNVPKDEDVQLAIMFTDLGTDFPSTHPKYDVFWGVPVGGDGYDGMDISVPFGQKIPVPMATTND